MSIFRAISKHEDLKFSESLALFGASCFQNNGAQELEPGAPFSTWEKIVLGNPGQLGDNCWIAVEIDEDLTNKKIGSWEKMGKFMTWNFGYFYSNDVCFQDDSILMNLPWIQLLQRSSVQTTALATWISAEVLTKELVSWHHMTNLPQILWELRPETEFHMCRAWRTPVVSLVTWGLIMN